MDRPRTDQQLRRRRRWLIAGAVALTLTGVTVALARLEPAVPSVERSLVWIDTVKRGAMLREVRGIGTLVPEDITWITASTSGRVERIVLQPGAVVKPEDVILVLTNPQAKQAALDADSQLRSAEAAVVLLKNQLDSGLLESEAAAAQARADYQQARLKAEVNDRLFRNGLVSELEQQLSRVTAEQAKMRQAIAEKRFAFTHTSIAPQLAVKRAEVEQARAQARLRHEDLESLQVRAGMTGVLQVLAPQVEVGAQVAAGASLARVADPVRLKAQVRVAETQARDVQIGQTAAVDTRNGVISGRVARIDPAVREGTVTVDITLTGELPRGARPDLSVEGTIELERLENVLYVGRPAVGQEKSAASLYRLDAAGAQAERVSVELGRSSVNTIEVLKGLNSGDKVILSDMSQWDEHKRIGLK